MTKALLSPRTKKLEAVIERGMASFVEVGNALLAIREERRYREGGYTSFDAYCQERWNMARRDAGRMIEAAKVTVAVGEISPTVPANAGQARELSRADAPAEVWAEVVAEHEPEEITAKVIREHVEARKAPRPAPADSPAEVIEDAEIVDPHPLDEAVTVAVRAAIKGGRTSHEINVAYQEGLS